MPHKIKIKKKHVALNDDKNMKKKLKDFYEKIILLEKKKNIKIYKNVISKITLFLYKKILVEKIKYL